MSNEQIEAVEISLEQAKSTVGKMQALQRLLKNKDFNEIFTTGYFEKEASRLVILKADPSQQSDEDQALIDKAIIAVGHSRQYLMAIMQMGKIAERTLRDDEDTLNELREEQE